MKLVASSKLRKAQRTIEALRPYEEALSEIVASLRVSGSVFADTPEAPENRGKVASGVSAEAASKFASDERAEADSGKVAVVAISSNSSLCGGFNSTVIKKALEVAGRYANVEVVSLGRKMAEAMKKAGYPAAVDYTELVAHPSFDKTAELVRDLAGKFDSGELSKVILVYNHFVSTAKQVSVEEVFLPFDSAALGCAAASSDNVEEDYILEPSAKEMLESLLPRVMRLKLHTAVLDSAAAEQAARTVAMQTATDNAEDLLGELTLEYNKGRQQKITSEILDLLGGSAQ